MEKKYLFIQENPKEKSEGKKSKMPSFKEFLCLFPNNQLKKTIIIYDLVWSSFLLNYLGQPIIIINDIMTIFLN